MSAACPSAAWDRYAAEQDDAAEERANVLAAHRDQMLVILCALMLRHDVPAPTTVENRTALLKMAEGLLCDWHYYTSPIE